MLKMCATAVAAGILFASAGLVTERLLGAVAAAEEDTDGKRGKRGRPGPPGPPGSARAFGFVNAGLAGANKLDPVRSKNILQATRPATGIYCIAFTGEAEINVATIAPIATPEWINTGPFDSIVFWDSRAPSSSGCPAGTAVIRTVDASGTNLVNTISFSVAIP